MAPKRLNIYELKLASHAEPLRPTDRHPILSETRQEWVPAVQLQPGELVKTASGSVTVESISRLPGMHRVYNMEVEEDHRYFAGAAEVLSHNADEGPKCTQHLNLGGEGELPGAVIFNNMDGILNPAQLAGKPIISGDLLEPWPMLKESVGQISARRLWDKVCTRAGVSNDFQKIGWSDCRNWAECKIRCISGDYPLAARRQCRSGHDRVFEILKT